MSVFSVGNFLDKKVSVGEPFSVSLFSGIENVWIRRGISGLSVESFLSYSAEKFRRGTP